MPGAVHCGICTSSPPASDVDTDADADAEYAREDVEEIDRRSAGFACCPLMRAEAAARVVMLRNIEDAILSQILACLLAQKLKG